MFPWKIRLGRTAGNPEQRVAKREENPWAAHAPARLGELPDVEPVREDRPREALELDRIPLPDLLWPQPHAKLDHELVETLFELAFLGKEEGPAIDRALETADAGPPSWEPAAFEEALFIEQLARSCLRIEHHGRRYPVHTKFVARVLANPPCELESIRFRQAITSELTGDSGMRTAAEELHRELHRLLALLKASKKDSRLNSVNFRLDILRQARTAIDLMVSGFAEAQSGLVRLHEVGLEIQASNAYQLLTALLDHHDSAATLTLSARIGGTGRLSSLTVTGIEENTSNLFHRSPMRRWADLVRLALRRFSLDSNLLVDRLVLGVYLAIAPAVRSLAQVLCHLEVYLSSLGFAALAQEHGLSVCLPDVDPGLELDLDGLFNPLLIGLEEVPIPCRIEAGGEVSITFVTGPNSGGKTRLLQAVGLAQMFGQSGLLVPCRRARLPVCRGLFASITAPTEADQVEGRLGSELLRVRKLLETAPPGSLVLLDELCSGTNPSEAIEIVTMVLQLLHELSPVALITTHFLDFARQLEADRPVEDLHFLQVEVDEARRSTYQFVPGVAMTSMAAATARRLGVTFEELLKTIRQRSHLHDVVVGDADRSDHSAEEREGLISLSDQ